MSDAELMQEVEMLRMAEHSLRKMLLNFKFELRVGSSEVLDAILEECGV